MPYPTDKFNAPFNWDAESSDEGMQRSIIDRRRGCETRGRSAPFVLATPAKCRFFRITHAGEASDGSGCLVTFEIDFKGAVPVADDE
jgi:hypothetical protein